MCGLIMQPIDYNSPNWQNIMTSHPQQKPEISQEEMQATSW